MGKMQTTWRNVLHGLMHAICWAGLAMPGAVHAESRTVDMTVKAKVGANCTIAQTQTIAFGIIQNTRTNIDAQGDLVVKCSNTLPYTVYLSDGYSRLPLANGGMRRMQNQDPLLQFDVQQYQVYKNSARTQVIDQTGGSATPGGSGGISQTGTGANQTITLYGRIRAGTIQARAGSYLDNLTVTVAW